MNISTPPKRIMLKLSGEALKGKSESGFDFDMIDSIAKKIGILSKKGIEIAIVLGGGNFFRGSTGAKNGMDKATGDYIGMLATIMNGIAMGEALERNGLSSRVMSAVEMPKISELFIRKKAIHYLEKKKIVICAGGTGNPFFTTDSAAVQRALELNCEYVVKGTKVDGVYDKDPLKFPDAQRFDVITVKEALTKGLDIMDHSAIAMAMDNNLPLFVCKIQDIDQIGTATIRGTELPIS